MADDNKPDHRYQIFRISEHQKTIRWALVGATIFGCVWLITDAVVDITTQPEPPWLTLGLACLAPFAVGGYPFYRVIKWARRFIETTASRTSELEKELDEHRSSSNLRKDGTLPDD